MLLFLFLAQSPTVSQVQSTSECYWLPEQLLLIQPILFCMISFMSQITFKPHPDWSLLQVQFKIFDEHS